MHKEDGLSAKPILQKAYFIAKMSGPAGQFWLFESALSKTKTVGSPALSVRPSPEIIEVSIL